MGRLIDRLDLRGTPVGTIIDKPGEPRKRTRLYQSRHESPAVKWVELIVLLAVGFFGTAGMAGVIAKAGAPGFAGLLVLAGIGTAVWAWCSVYVES
jgi:hypothetical protein